MMSAPEKAAELLERIRPLAGSQSVYLVGGAVRDLLLRRPIHDYDFAVSDSAATLARRVANALGGAFYVMDAENDVARVLVGDPQARLDFARLRAGDLQSDLRARDFTINSLALDVRDPDNMIDPHGGAADLQAGLLRAAAPAAFRDDPIRVLRAARLAIALQLRIEPQTRAWLADALPLLENTSAERQRDELFRMLDGPRAHVALRLLDTLGALEIVLPETSRLKGIEQSAPHVFDVWEHTLHAVQSLESLLNVLVGEYTTEAVELFHGIAVLQLGRYRHQLQQHFASALNPERSSRALLTFALLYHDISKPDTQTFEDDRIRFLTHDELGTKITAQRAEALALSRAEVERVSTIVRHHMRLHWLAHTGRPPSRRAVYRFFRDTGPAGVDICLHSLADLSATYHNTLPPGRWESEVAVARALLEGWYERKEDIVSPKALLNGHELIADLGMEPGPDMGRLLESIREKQAEGKIEDKQQAVRYARQWLRSQGGNDHGKHAS